ncbi:VIR protein [Plasmodium vivax]|uniref:VIR protein n=1 Tax=Plasmodium vivax TaxID=5855 RepID=A0A1G4ECF6_PLAVI|nr:VIR protein [Plasmodium vivax]
MLQKEVEDKLSKNYDSDFVEIFQKFLRKYGEKFSQRKDRCISKIDPIETTRFNNMDALHRLYDKLRNYSGYATANMPSACGEFSLFITEYNDYILNNKSKSEFFNRILQNFYNGVEKTFSDFKLQCSEYPLHLISPKLHEPEPEPVKKIEYHSPTQAGQRELQSGGAKSQTESHEDLDRANTQLPQEKTESASITEKTVRAETHTDDDIHRVTSYQHTTHNHITEIDAVPEIPPQYEPPLRGFVYLRPQSQPQHQEYIESQEPSNEPARDSSTIIGFITNVIKDVDPVPVVGVSGGMGALFLLFRYTPFGTFFRGGRGRVHRIPRSFNGQFLGGFPGYEDYDVGHIGYGPMNPLAE